MENKSSNEEKSSKIEDGLPIDDHPELIFGLVGPIGVDLESVTEVLKEALKEVGYDSCGIRITDLMREVKVDLPLDATEYVESFKQRIAYANMRQLSQRVRAVTKRTFSLQGPDLPAPSPNLVPRHGDIPNALLVGEPKPDLPP